MAYGMKLGGANLAFKGGLLNATRYIGLFSAEGTELSGNNYNRVGIALAGWQADGSEYENVAVQTFGPPNPGAWLPIVGWGLFANSTGGTRLFDVDITDTAAPGIGASVTAAAEAIGYGFTGAVTSDGSLAALSEGLLSGTRYITLHPGASPTKTEGGDAGTTSNAIATNGAVNGGGTPLAVQAQASNWTVDNTSNTNARARNNAVLSYGIQAADLPQPGSIALRDGNAHTSNILWTAALTADDPDLGDALQFNVNAITIPMTITAVV